MAHFAALPNATSVGVAEQAKLHFTQPRIGLP